MKFNIWPPHLFKCLTLAFDKKERKKRKENIDSKEQVLAYVAQTCTQTQCCCKLIQYDRRGETNKDIVNCRIFLIGLSDGLCMAL